MPLLENFTGIDIFERVAQAMYCCMLLFVPSFWLEDNFTKYKTAKPDAQDIALCRILGVLCICIFIAVSQLRINGVNLKSADLMSVCCWGMCIATIFIDKDLYNDHAFKTNLGLQSLLVGLFAYQYATRKPTNGKSD